MPRSTLPVDLGRYGDNPDEIAALAFKYLRDDPRLAAERTYLAMHTALENLIGSTFRTDRAQAAAVAQLAKRSHKLAAQFNELKSKLHGHCFYQAECDARSTRQTMVAAMAWISRLPSSL